MEPDRPAPASPPPPGLTGPVGRLVAVLLGLVGALVAGVLRALAEAFARALGARSDDDDERDARG